MDIKNSDMGQAFKIAVIVNESKDSDYKCEQGDKYFSNGVEKPEGMCNPVELAGAEAKYVESMFEIVEDYGKLADDDGNGIWVGYISAKDNKEKARKGVMCSNCAFFCPVRKTCHIVKQEIEPGGYCRLAAIGEGLAKGRRSK